MSKVNLKLLALELNVSTSTVSKALRGSYDIGSDTRKRVIELAQKKGYTPNPYASFLRQQKSKTIALIAPELTNNFFIQAISGAQTVAQERDYHILIYTTDDSFEKEQSILKHLQNGRVDGIIISLASNTKTYHHLEEIIQSGVPVVFFDRVCHEIETAKITTDDFTSGFNATEHLILNGCRDIAYLSISENLSIDNKRKQGYFEALNKHDIPVSKARIIRCGDNEETNTAKIKQLLQGSERPEGIFASVEKLALTTYYACQDLNIKIPQDLKVISFSNLRTAPLLDPSLTTITQPAWEMGKQAASVLFRNLDKKHSLIQNENIVLKSELIQRNSTRSSVGAGGGNEG